MQLAMTIYGKHVQKLEENWGLLLLHFVQSQGGPKDVVFAIQIKVININRSNQYK